MRIAFLYLCLLTIAVYARDLWSPFVYDDPMAISLNPEINMTGSIPILHEKRLISMVSLRLNYLFSENHPFGYHVTSLAIHLVNGGLVGLLAMALGLTESWAIFAMGVFLLHPLQAQAVLYSTARPDLMAGTGMFAAMLLFIRKRWILAGLVGLLGMLTKENAFLIPVFWLAWYVHAGGKAWKALLLSLGGSIVILSHPGIPESLYNMGHTGAGWQFPIQAYGYLALLLRSIFPWGFTIDHDFSRITVGLGVLSVIALISFLVLAWIYRKTPQGFALLWIVMLTPPYLFGLPQGYLQENHMYVPFFGVILLICLWLQHIHQRKDISHEYDTALSLESDSFVSSEGAPSPTY